MKLSKEIITSLKTGVSAKLAAFSSNGARSASYDLLSGISKIFAHIEVLEQELDFANGWIERFQRTNKGALLKENTELKQENLQRLEEVEGLQVELEKVKKSELRHRENERLLMVHRAEAYEKHKVAYVEISRLKTAYEAEKEARMLLEATLEQALLDHQPVVLPKEVAGALDDFRKSDDPRINTNLYILECHLSSNSVTERQKAIRTVPFDTFLKALVNGYTVEQTPEEANEAAFRAGMEAIYKEMDARKFTDLSLMRDYFDNKLIPLIKEIYQH